MARRNREPAVGLRNWLHHRRMSDPVGGTLRLTYCSAGASDALYSDCEMHGVLIAPDLDPVAVEHVCTAPTRRWPQPGQTLPVRVDRADPTRIKVLWREMPTIRDRARQHAQREAERLAGGLRPATARVLAVHDVPILPESPGTPPAGLADVTLDVELPDGSGYSTIKRIAFITPRERATVTEIGAILPVLVNPADRDQIDIDISQFG